MLRKSLIIVSLVLLGKAIPVYGTQIAYVHMERILNEYMDLRDAKRELQRALQQWEQTRDSLRAILDSMKAEYERERVMMTDEQKILKEREIQEYEQQYQSYWKSIWGKGGKLDQKTRELIDPLIRKVHETIYKIAEEMGYDLVLDISQDVILYASGENDITQDVLEELNKGYAAAGTQLGIKPKLAIFPLRELNQEASVRDLGNKIANYLQFGFQNSPKFDVLPTGQARSLVERRGLNLQTLTPDQCYPLAQDMQAELFIYGTVEVTGEQARIKVQLYSLLDRKMLVEQETTAPADRETELSVAVQNLALQISQQYQPQ